MCVAGWWVCEKGKQGTGRVKRGRSTSGEQRGKDGQSTALLLPGPGAQDGTRDSEDAQHHLSVSLDPVGGSCFLSSSSWLGLHACPVARAELSAVKSTIIQGCSRCFLSVSAMNGEAPGPEMASHTHSPTRA